MFLDLSYNRIEVVDILPARRVQAGGPMWQTINLEIKGGSDHFHNNRAVAEGDNVSFYAIFCVCKSWENFVFNVSKDCHVVTIFFLDCSKIMKMPLETIGVNITVNMISQTACPDRHDVMCCLPPSYLGSAYVSGVWTVTK